MIKAQIAAGPRGSGLFYPVTMDEALRTATMWLSMLRFDNPDTVALSFGRQADSGLIYDWARAFGTPEIFCDAHMRQLPGFADDLPGEETRLVLLFGSGAGRSQNGA